jgi:hypothetical protein
MRIKNLSKNVKLERVLQLAERLTIDAIIAIPPQHWNQAEQASNSDVKTKTPEEGGGAESPPLPRRELTEEEAAARKESAILRRLGFIFIAYRADYWWWEGVEMLRKFLMTWSSFPIPLSSPSCPASSPALLVRLYFSFWAPRSCVLCAALHPDPCSPCVADNCRTGVGNQLITPHTRAHDTAFWCFCRRTGLGSLRPGRLSPSSSC